VKKTRLNERQRRLIEDAREAHREAQVHGRPAPERLVEKWSSEVGIEKPKDIEQETADQ
jgi:hypothetical protein